VRAMRQVAAGVWQLRGFPADMFNVYLMEDVLVDAATRWARGRVLSQLRRRRPRLMALTHCHPDHQGVARLVCRQFRIPLACHEHDVPAMEGRVPMVPGNWFMRMGVRIWAGPSARVTRVLRDGDEVAGFRVVHTPGHTPGHITFFRESDRVAVAGDVLANMNFLTGKPGLREPPPFFSDNAAQNSESVRKLVALRPSVVCFGHGPPLYRTEILEKMLERIDARRKRVESITGKRSTADMATNR
jgi:glyoxylase-like metal-dependent hydrolase (beta-lactamase superfamily II)